MLDSLILFAEGAAAPPGNDGNGLFIFFMVPAILILIWFFMMNPQKKQEEQRRKMLDSLEKNDRVMTVGGLIGTVHTLDKEQNEIVLKVDDSNNTKIRFHLTAINAVFPKDNSSSK